MRNKIVVIALSIFMLLLFMGELGYFFYTGLRAKALFSNNEGIQLNISSSFAQNKDIILRISPKKTVDEKAICHDYFSKKEFYGHHNFDDIFFYTDYWTNVYNLDKYTVLSLFWTESRFKSTVVQKRTGAIGLGQIMPEDSNGALDEWNKYHPENRYTNEDMFDVSNNIEVCCWYIDKIRDTLARRGIYAERDIVQAYWCGPYQTGPSRYAYEKYADPIMENKVAIVSLINYYCSNS